MRSFIRSSQTNNRKKEEMLRAAKEEKEKKEMARKEALRNRQKKVHGVTIFSISTFSSEKSGSGKDTKRTTLNESDVGTIIRQVWEMKKDCLNDIYSMKSEQL